MSVTGVSLEGVGTCGSLAPGTPGERVGVRGPVLSTSDVRDVSERGDQLRTGDPLTPALSPRGGEGKDLAPLSPSEGERSRGEGGRGAEILITLPRESV